MTVECRKVQKYLLEAAEETLGVELRAQFLEHTGRCVTCRESFEFTQKAVASFRRIPSKNVPGEIWESVAAQIAKDRAVSPRVSFGWWQRLSEIFAEISWGQRVAWSSALATALVMLAVWGVWDIGQGPGLRVVDVAGSPGMAFPSYLREHNNPAGQPISEGPMVLAFNTLGDGTN